MKRVFSFTSLLLAVFLISSCTPFSTIPKLEFTFVNDRTDSDITITPTPSTGEDWSAITVTSNGGRNAIESENSSIYFTAVTISDSNEIMQNEHYRSYDPATRTYTFYNYLDNP
jgi:hypothetical protein